MKVLVLFLSLVGFVACKQGFKVGDCFSSGNTTAKVLDVSEQVYKVQIEIDMPMFGKMKAIQDVPRKVFEEKVKAGLEDSKISYCK